MIAFETVIRDVMATRLMKSQERATPLQPRSGLSRRGFLLGACSASGLAAGAVGRFGSLQGLFLDRAITVTKTAEGLKILAGGATWHLVSRAFGPQARLSWQQAQDGVRIRISEASWPGLVMPFFLAVRLSPMLAGGFRLTFRAPALGYRAVSDWMSFVTGARADGQVHESLALRLSRRLRLTKAMMPAGLGLAASGDWSLLGRSDIGGPSVLGTLGVRTDGANELGRYASRAVPPSSTLVRIDQWHGALSGAARTRSTAGEAVVLEPTQISQRQIEAFEGNLVIERTDGCWRIGSKAGNRSEIVCRDLTGALVRLRRGASVETAALLALPESGLKIAGAVFHAHVKNGALMDGLRWQTASGTLSQGIIHGMLAKIDAHLAGADRATLGFNDQPVALHFARPPCRAKEPSGAPKLPPRIDLFLYKKGSLRLPLDNAVLHVVRGVDLVNIAFRFRNMHLAAGAGGSRLVPTLRGKALRFAMANECDTRPMLIAELPPQHVLERAFYKRPPAASSSLANPNVPRYPNVRLDPWPPVDPFGKALVTWDAQGRAVAQWAQIEAQKRSRDPDYWVFVKYYESVNGVGSYVPADPPIAGLTSRNPSDPTSVASALADLAKGAAIDDWRESRVSGKTRLSFTFPFDPSARRPDLRRATQGLKFALADLMDWDRLEPVVARRASSFDVADAKLHQRDKGALPPRAGRLPTLLAYKGVAAGKDLKTRLQQVADIAALADYETAIEIPARLVLSPDQTARFASSRLAKDAYRSGAVNPIWTARLRVDEQGARVRAIASPDYQSAVYTDPKNTPYPQRGIKPPWDAREATFRASMSPADRHELVALTSLIGLPILPAGPPNAKPKDGEALRLAATNVPPPENYIVDGLSQQNQNIYVPDGMLVSELTLSGLHGSIAIDDHFQPPAAALLDDMTNGAFPALNVEAAHIRAVLGYDHDVAISYKGFLFPLGIPATLVKQTSRAVVEMDGVNVSYLEQVYYIRTPGKVRRVPMQGQPFDGRDLPFTSLKPKGGNSPDIRDPYIDIAAGVGLYEVDWISGTGRINLGPQMPGVAFWPIDLSSPDGGPYKVLRFEVGVDNRGARLSVPLIFIDNTAAHDSQMLQALVEYYMHHIPMTDDDKTGAHAFLRFAEVSGASLTYALETAGGQCSFETRRFLLGARSKTEVNPIPGCEIVEPADGKHGFKMDAPLEGMNQLPVYPFVVESHIGLANVQHFTGEPVKLARVGYNELFTRYGFGAGLNPNAYYLDVFGDLDDTSWLAPDPQPTILPIAGHGQRSGFAQPASVIAHMARLKGPVGGNAPLKPPCELKAALPPGPVVKIAGRTAPRARPMSLGGPGAPTVPAPIPSVPAATPTRFDPMQAFSSDAKLLGLVSICDVIKAALFKAAPNLAQEMDDAVDQAQDAFDALCEELQTYVGKIDEGFHAAEAWLGAALTQITSITFAGKSISLIYPAAVAACTAVDTKFKAITGNVDALQTALDAKDQRSVVKAAQDVYANLSGFNDALADLAVQLRRIATDPAPNLLNAAIGAMSSFFGKGFDDLLTAIGPKLQSVRHLLDTALSDPKFNAYRATLLGTDCYAAPPMSIAELVSGEKLTSTARALGFQSYVRPALAAYDQFTALAAQGQAAIGQLPARLLALTGEVLIALEAQIDPISLRYALTQGVLPADLVTLVKGLLTEPTTSLLRQSGFVDPLVAIEGLIGDLVTLEGKLAGAGDAKKAALGNIVKSWRASVAAAFGQFSQANGFITGGIIQLGNTLGKSDISAAAAGFTGAVAQIANARRDAIAAARALITASQAAYQALVALADVSELAKDIATIEASISTVIDLALALLSAATSLSATKHDAAYVPRAVPGTALGDLQHGLTTDVGDTATKLEAARKDSAQPYQTAITKKDLAAALAAADQLSAQIVAFATEQEAVALGWVASAVTLPGEMIDAGMHTIVPAIADIADAAVAAWAAAVGALDAIIKVLPQPGPASVALAGFLSVFAPDLHDLPDLLSMAHTSVAFERDALASLAGQIRATKDLHAVEANIAGWRSHFDLIARGGSQLQVTIALIASAMDRLAKFHIDQAIDFSALSRQLEQAVIAAIAPNLSLSYTLNAELNDIGSFFSMNRDPKGLIARDPQITQDLSIKFTSAMTSTGTPLFHIESRIQPFIVNVFDIVNLFFAAGRFSGGSGQSFDMDLKVADFALGDSVSFLSQLAPFMSIGGDDDSIKFLVTPSVAPVGIRALLTIDLGTISLGEISFINVNFAAAVMLPFENQPAQFTVALASRAAPFLICCMPYGGGGFLSMTANTHSIVSFEASFEFGVVLAFSYGPLQAVGYVCTGIYVAKSGDGAEISAFFLASGSAHIACFGVSACLLVSMTAKEGNLTGSATFTFSFSLGLCDISYSVGVAHQIAQWGGGGGHKDSKPTKAAALRGSQQLRALTHHSPTFGAEADAGRPRRRKRRPTKPPVLTNNARSMDAGWATYKRYFRGDI